MNAGLKSITLSEWQTLGPENCQQLHRTFIEDTADCRRLAKSLFKSRMLGLIEKKDGLEVSAYSYVGRIRIGNLEITVLPKLNASSLLGLLRYAFGFSRLKLLSDTTHFLDQFGFEDLLVSQLNAEAQELVSRGLQRSYVAQHDWLSSPKGRINIDQLAFQAGRVTTRLPCQHCPRIEDTSVNRVLMAGLRFASSIASSIDLRRESRRLVSMMEEQVSTIRLDSRVLDHADRSMNRLTNAYIPAFSIIRLLVEAQSIVLEGKTLTSKLPGFLFDMNLFFQTLLSRFLRENLAEFTVRDEHGLKGMMRYSPDFNPLNRRSSTPRPDYAVLHQGKLRALLDAKYRDLWEKSLPRDMLYQLVVYSVSNSQNPTSAILYPSLNDKAKEARIDVSEPLHGKPLGQVCLRPVNLYHLEELVSQDSPKTRRARTEEASRLAFGEKPNS